MVWHKADSAIVTLANFPSVSSAEAPLEGNWIPLAADISGRELDVATLRVARFIVEAGCYRILDRQQQVADAGELHVDTAHFPHAVDLIGVEGPAAGKRIQAIFELEGDRLRLCYDLENAARPAAMQPQQDQLLLRITYERVAARLSS